MATPLSPFINARIEHTVSGGRGGPEVGFKQLPGQKYLVTAFLKQDSEKFRSNFNNEIDLNAATDKWKGYIVGFVAIDDADDYKTYAFDQDSAYDATGKRPPEFAGPKEVKLAIGDREFSSAQLLNTASQFGDEGIGQIIRDVIGDRLIIETETW